MISAVFLFIFATVHVNAQFSNVLPPNAFLAQLFNVASNEIDNIANTFRFQEVSPEDVTYVLHLDNGNIINFNHKNTTLIDPRKPTKILIHGWQASASDDSHRKMAEKYHKNGAHNVISIDWGKHAKKVYMHSSSSTKNVGEVLGDYISEVTRLDPKLLDNFHLIGTSLGGHVAGFAGQKVHQRTRRRVGRITGLDVAAPLFEVPTKMDHDSKLSGDDADFVDVIHTNAGFLGVTEAIGTADFYVANGGPIQPGCFDPLNIFESIGCSHGKAVEYFLSSIDGKKYEALSCKNSIEYHTFACNGNRKVIMGEHVPRTASGSYYLEPESALPFGGDFMENLGIKLPRLRLPFIN